ncbi:MAG: FG-GAP-like repeat-containing protein, partial [Planctomycetales bacterium]
MSAPGAIHVPVSDFDGDGDLDIVTVISQDEEEVWGFENLGKGKFRRHPIHSSINFDLGSAGLVKTDLDGDGDQDLLLPVGDNLEDSEISFAQTYHGCYWLENLGDWHFKSHRIARLGGCYAAASGDLDGDGDQDVVLVSMDNEWSKPGNPSIVWLENNGQQQFQPWSIADRPVNLTTVACGDLNGDDRIDIVTGGLRWLPPWDRLGRVTRFINQGRDEAVHPDSTPDNNNSHGIPITENGIPTPDMAFQDRYTIDAIKKKQQQLDQALESGKDIARQWQSLADAYLANGFFRSAETCYSMARDAGANAYLFYYRWAACCERLGRMKSAIELFSKAASLGGDRQKDNCWYSIGQIRLRLEQPLKAEKAFERADNFFLARYQLAKLYIRSDRVRKAVPILDDILKSSSYAIQPLWLRGRAAEMMGDQREADAFFELADRATIITALDINKAVLLDADSGYGLDHQLARVLELNQRGKIEEAAAIARQFLELRPEDAYFKYYLSAAAITLRQNHPQQAIDILKRLIELFGASPLPFDSLDMLGRAYLQANEKELAAKTWEQAIRLAPSKEIHGQLSKL